MGNGSEGHFCWRTPRGGGRVSGEGRTLRLPPGPRHLSCLPGDFCHHCRGRQNLRVRLHPGGQRTHWPLSKAARVRAEGREKAQAQGHALGPSSSAQSRAWGGAAVCALTPGALSHQSWAKTSVDDQLPRVVRVGTRVTMGSLVPLFPEQLCTRWSPG